MKTYAEKRFFKWQEDDVAVSIRAKSGSYGGGSEVFVVGNAAENTVAYGYDSYNQTAYKEVAHTLKSNGGGDDLPRIIVFRDDVTIKIDEEDVAFTLGARDFKGVQCVSYESSKHREWATAQCEHDGDHESVRLHARRPGDS